MQMTLYLLLIWPQSSGVQWYTHIFAYLAQFFETKNMEESVAIIVGAGPSGLATSACLRVHSIPHILLDREDCFASLWKKYSYDRLHLHLRKHFCQLPHLPFPPSYPSYISKHLFLQYLDDYVSKFNISPLYGRCVELAEYDEGAKKWKVTAKNATSCQLEEYSARFLVVASGETCDPYVPDVEGLSTFSGEILHSTKYKNGKAYRDKRVLVVGSGNSGMEIALDMANHGAKTSIVVRSPVHILNKEIMYLGGTMLKYGVPLSIVDSVTAMLGKIMYGDVTKYGIARPTEGPFYMKVTYGKYPIFDVGTYNKIRDGEIQVLPAMEIIRGNEVVFVNDKSYPFDTIVFCTGFKRSTNKWLKDDEYLLNEEGLPKPSYPYHWKGKKGLYCVGLARRGLYGASADALNIAGDIKSLV